MRNSRARALGLFSRVLRGALLARGRPAAHNARGDWDWLVRLKGYNSEALSGGVNREKSMEKKAMGDRTFSAEDVLRIYDLYLDSNEQETVEEFFKEDTSLPDDLQLTGLANLVELFDELTPLLSLLAPIASVFSTVAVTLVRDVTRQVAGLSRFLSQEIAQRSVDA